MSVKDESKTQTLRGDKLLVAIGVQGNVEGVCAESLGVAVDRGHFAVDYRQPETKYETNVPGVHAVGDVIGPPWLAHVASEEAIVCVERIAGHEVVDIDYESIPGCTYCHPQVASIGLTERACAEAGMNAGEDYTSGQVPATG